MMKIVFENMAFLLYFRCDLVLKIDLSLALPADESFSRGQSAFKFPERLSTRYCFVFA